MSIIEGFQNNFLPCYIIIQKNKTYSMPLEKKIKELLNIFALSHSEENMHTSKSVPCLINVVDLSYIFIM
jgi:hypothetical protein